jgi:CO/xanthine dehydrogenase FAD-binding subunit
MNIADCPPIALAEALDRLAAMPAFLDQALAGRTREQLRRRTTTGGDFSLVEHACHLRDLEREGYLARVRRILAEERPALADFPGDVIARERDYRSQDAFAAAAEFARARTELIAALAVLGPVELCRKAVFDGREITLAGLVAMVAGHDGGHRAEIEALAASLEVP